MKKKHKTILIILLAVFMAITIPIGALWFTASAFIKEEGISLKSPSSSPEAQEQVAEPPRIITIKIDQENVVSINERVIDAERARANIEAKLAEDSRSPILIRVHNDALNETLLSIVDQARSAGVEHKKITVARTAN